jgi:hypothetical protein
MVLYILIFKSLEKRREDKDSEMNGSNFLRIYSARNSFMTVILICSCLSQTFELSHIFDLFVLPLLCYDIVLLSGNQTVM